jgi:hypothetical protein
MGRDNHQTPIEVKMKVSKRSLFVLILVVLFAASCAGQAPTEATVDIDATLTAGVGTFAAYFFQTQTAMVTPATETPSPTITPTITPVTATVSPTAIVFFPVLATQSLAPAATITGTNYTKTPAPVAYGCNNLQLLNDYAVSPNSTMQVNALFTKSWKVANTGTCNWTAGYRLVQVSGEAMGITSVSVKNPPVVPGKWQTYELSLEAPKSAGTYTAYWQMRDGAGNKFGSLLGVTITVKTVYP